MLALPLGLFFGFAQYWLSYTLDDPPNGWEKSIHAESMLRKCFRFRELCVGGTLHFRDGNSKVITPELFDQIKSLGRYRERDLIKTISTITFMEIGE